MRACSKVMPHIKLRQEAGPTISTQRNRIVTMSTIVWLISHANVLWSQSFSLFLLKQNLSAEWQQNAGLN